MLNIQTKETAVHPRTLFHTTTADKAASIMAGGFRDHATVNPRLSTNTKNDISTFIKDQDDGISIAFEHTSESGPTLLTVGWSPSAGDKYNADNQDLSGNDGLMYVEFAATGDREAAGLIKALVELGDQLRPIHEQLEREADQPTIYGGAA